MTSGPQPVFHQVCESASFVRFTAQVGQTVPLYATVIGRALLSQMPRSQRESVLKRTTFHQFTPKTVMGTEAVERNIDEARARGWFEGVEGFSENLAGVALPLATPPYTYALLISGPKERLAYRLEEIATAMRKGVETYLGFTPRFDVPD